MPTTPTRITLGGVSLDVDSFQWMLTPGVTAYGIELNAFPKTSKALAGLKSGPHIIKIRAPSATLGMQKLTIKGIYLKNDKPLDEVSTGWKINDRRIWFDWTKVTRHYNIRRRLNDKIGLDVQDQFTYSAESYAPYSNFKSLDKEGKEVHTLWTAVGALYDIFNSVDPSGLDNKSFANVEDNGVPIESQSYYQQAASSIIPTLLVQAELNFYVSLEGKYRFYSRLLPETKHKVWKMRGHTRGRFTIQKNNRSRPSEIIVWFRQENEKYAEFIEGDDAPKLVALTGAGKIRGGHSEANYKSIAAAAGIKIISAGARRARRRRGRGEQTPAVDNFISELQEAIAPNNKIEITKEPILLENVAQVPRTVRVPVEGLGTVEFTRGEWINFDLLLAAWKLLDDESGNKPLIDITKENIQKFWFSNVFGRMYAYNRNFPTWIDPERSRRVAVIREFYRRYFRIAKPWMDHIHKWSPERVGIVDPITRTQALPFVSTQYCDVPNFRPPVGAPKDMRIAAVNVNDFDEDDTELKGAQSPYIFTQIGNPDLGILQIQAMVDQTDVIRDRIRGMVDRIPNYDLNPDGSILWQRAALQKNFKLRVIITVEWGSPNDQSRMYPLTSKIGGGEGGTLEFGSFIDSARVDVLGNVVNGGLLQKMAAFEIRSVTFTHRDVGVGYKHFTGLRKEMRPEGACRGVSFNIENGFAYTMYDLSEPYTNRPANAIMDPKLREFALRIAEVK